MKDEVFVYFIIKFQYTNLKMALHIIKKDKNNVNVKINTTQTYKLADFGFAKQIDLNGGTVLGSEPFMSPEVFSSEKYGFEVDMWAFGVIFYFMLNMEYPFSYYALNLRTESSYAP